MHIKAEVPTRPAYQIISYQDSVTINLSFIEHQDLAIAKRPTFLLLSIPKLPIWITTLRWESQLWACRGINRTSRSSWIRAKEGLIWFQKCRLTIQGYQWSVKIISIRHALQISPSKSNLDIEIMKAKVPKSLSNGIFFFAHHEWSLDMTTRYSECI